jgi:type IV secretion system protein VirB4
VPDGKLNLRERLERWCVGHENGWVFDNAADSLDFGNQDLFGFDLTEFLGDGPVRDAALTYLLYRTDQINDGTVPFLYAFDEVQHPLEVPYFQRFMRDSPRTIRKKDGVFIFATQEPHAVTETPTGKTMIQQSATVCYLPNDKATAADYIDGFKLTPAEFRMVQELGEFSRQFIIKQGESTVTAILDLHQCQDALLVFSGSPDMAAIAEKAVEERGSDPEQWLPLYLERARAATKK